LFLPCLIALTSPFSPSSYWHLAVLPYPSVSAIQTRTCSSPSSTRLVQGRSIDNMVFCTYCGQSFTRDEHLERHILTRWSPSIGSVDHLFETNSSKIPMSNRSNASHVTCPSHGGMFSESHIDPASILTFQPGICCNAITQCTVETRTNKRSPPSMA